MTITQASGSVIKDDMNRLGQGVGTVKKEIGNLAHDGAAAIRQGSHDAVEVAKDKLDDAQHYATDSIESVKDLITRHPFGSLSIAAGVGVVLGLLMFRRRS